MSGLRRMSGWSRLELPAGIIDSTDGNLIFYKKLHTTIYENGKRQ